MKNRFTAYLVIIVLMGILSALTVSAQNASTDSADAKYSVRDSVAIQKMQIKGYVLSEMDKGAKSAYSTMATIGVIIICAWLLLVIVYFVWAIRRYTINFGLSSHEWKVINPELYAKEGDEREKYKKIRNANIAVQNGVSTDTTKTSQGNETAQVNTIKVPDENPYRNDSFGLPPGTIRGVMALTTLVAFVIIECVNLFAPTNLEKDFRELLTVFEMVVAFYFGSRAVDLFKKRGETGEKHTTATPQNTPPLSTPTTVPETQMGTDQPVQGGSIQKKNTADVIQDLPNEQPALSLAHSIPRMANILPLVLQTLQKEKKDSSTIGTAPIAQRILALTSSFETGLGFPECFSALSGNFDGQGMSFGALQWCIGQKALQPLLGEMITANEAIVNNIFGQEKSQALKKMLLLPLSEQIAWANALQITDRTPNGGKRFVINAEWKDAFHQLGQTREMIVIQTKAASMRLEKARMNCSTYKLTSERGLALMFDINVQNGHVDTNGTGALIMKDYMAIENRLSGDELETERMRIVARRISAVVKPQWVADVLKRKLTIAEGKGNVHGKEYDLSVQFSLTLKPFTMNQNVT